ncbi:MAG: hypothetical protein ACMUIU_14330 [bacterium]
MDLSELGISGPGIALVCLKDQDKAPEVIDALNEIGLSSVSQALSQKEALDKMKYNLYDIVVIEDGFGGPIEESQIMSEFQNMSVSQRRQIFLVIIGDRWETANAIQAFSLSVNLIVNYRLLDKIKEGIASAMIRNNRFYKVFNECREAMGKV